MSRSRVLAFTFAALFAAAMTMYAQVTGTVTGAVIDPSDAAVPEAAVSLQLPGSGAAAFTTKTSTSGDFTILSVPPGTYDLVVEAKGFLKAVVGGLKVDTGRTVSVPAIRLALASVTQTVEVTEAGTAVATSNAEVTNTISQSQIAKLPVIDRSPMAFVYTQAGVNYGAGSTSINGQRSSYTNVTLDGINIQDNFIRTNDMDYIPNQLLLDQVSEVTISTSNASAANYGGSAQVSISTPSGSNEVHGQVFWTNRNNYFKSNSFTNNQSGIKVPFLNRNQIGGKLGGHIIKNKLFYYGNYEASRDHEQTTRNYTLLTANARNGIYTYKDSGGAIHQVNILTAMGYGFDPTMNKYLAQVPDATNINNYNVGDSTAALLRNTAGDTLLRRNNELRDNVTGRVDYIYSTRNSFSGSYAWNRDILDRPDLDTTYTVAPLQANNNPTKFLSAMWRFNPKANLTNEFRAGFNLANGVFLDSQTTPAYFITGTTYSNPVSGVTRTQGRHTNTYNLADNASWVHGSHSVQFGYQMQDVRIEQFNDAGITPSYSLGLGLNTPGLTTTQMPGASSTDISAANGLMATLAGLYSNYTATFNVKDRTNGYVPNYGTWRHDIQNNYALYVQDSWKVSRRLSANLGVRWDYYPPTDERDSLALLPVLENNNVIQTILDPNARLDFAGNSVGRPWWTPSKRHFAPNVGLAWDPTGDGKWAIRAGYSMSFVNDNLVRAADNSQASNAGLTSSVTSPTSLDGRFANGVVAIPTPVYKVPRTNADNYALTTSNAVAMPAPNLTTPYVQQWNIGVQRSIKGTLFEVRYVGNHSSKQIRGFDYNQVLINQILQPFQAAANNGWLAQAATGTFNATYNPAIAGSQPTTFFNAMPNSGYLTNSTVRSYLQTGQVGELANFYQTNLVNGPYNFYRNTNALGANVLTNYGNSSYNGLQTEITHRFAHGLQFQGSYVFSKVLSDNDGTGQTDFEPFLDMNNAKIERRRAYGYDITHQIKANYYYELPFGKGHALSFANPVLSRVISGWNMSGIWTMQSGTPFSVYSSRGTLNRAARSSGTNTVNSTMTLPQLDQLFQLYKNGNGVWFFPQANLNPTNNSAVAADGAAPFTGQVFTQPGAGTLGTLQRNMFSGPWVWNFDFKMAKMTRISERVNAELRMDAQNIFNHDTWFVGNQTITSTTFGKVTSNFYGRRELQFGLYLTF